MCLVGKGARIKVPGPRVDTEAMGPVSGLKVQLLTPEKERYEGLCRDIESTSEGLVALAAFPSSRAPGIALGEKTLLTFVGGGLISSVEAEGMAVLRSDDRSRRCYSFQLGSVPKSMLLLLANRRSSTRLPTAESVRVRLLDVPRDLPAKVALHDLSATGLSILVEPAVEKLLLKQVRLRFALELPGEHPIELAAFIRHRRILKSQVLYGLEFDGQMPEFMHMQERFLAYLAVLR